MTSAVEVCVTLVSHLVERYRSERHELGALELFVQPIISRRVLGVIHDRTVSQRARAEFHTPLKARDDVPLMKQFCEPLFERPVSPGNLLVFEARGLEPAANLFSGIFRAN